MLLPVIKNCIRLLAVLGCVYSPAFGQDKMSVRDITVLEEPADQMMNNYLTEMIDRQFAVRDSLLSAMATVGDWDQRARIIRDSLRSWTGPFPERTPLNARITGTIERDEYVIEKILFESRPGYLVSGNLYLPKNIQTIRPAVLNVVGHWWEGKARPHVQDRSIAQVRKGFVAFTIDGLGQGERTVPRYDHLGHSPGYSHGIIGTKAFIAGTHIFNFMVWDVIRAIDYLVERPEVDGENICITGCSGGGMMSTYILPFEDRIKVSIPVCNPNTWSHRVHAGLGCDHEQVFFGAFKESIDPRGDPLFCHVPGALMINATTDDILNPRRGVWELSSWLYRSYAAHGVPERFSTSMVRAPHSYNSEQIGIANAWMLKWTGGDASDCHPAEIRREKGGDLWVTGSGNIFNEPGSREPHDLVLEYLNDNRPDWQPVSSKTALYKHRLRMKTLVTNVLHMHPVPNYIQGTLREPVSMDDMVVRTFVLEPEEGIVLPGFLLEPAGNGPGKSIVLYLNRNGKDGLFDDIYTVKELLSRGLTVCAVDLRGIGETAPDMSGKFWSFLAGRPLLSQRVEDVLATVNWLKGMESEVENIILWGIGMGGLYAAFAGVLNEDISGFLLEEPLVSFESVVQVPIHKFGNEEILIPGILEQFDMAQVYQSLCPRPVTILNPLSGDKTPADKPETRSLDGTVSMTYRGLGMEGAWMIGSVDEEIRNRIILDQFSGNKSNLK